MKNLAALALAAILTFVTACAISEDDSIDQPEQAPAELTVPTASPEVIVPAEFAPAANPSCAPGPSGNWCSNREGHSCPTEGTRSRCYIPNYCEWAILRCEGGVWVMIG